MNGDWLTAAAVLSTVAVATSKVEMNKMWWPFLDQEAAEKQIPKAGGKSAAPRPHLDATSVSVALFEITHRLGLATLAVVDGLYRSLSSSHGIGLIII